MNEFSFCTASNREVLSWEKQIIDTSSSSFKAVKDEIREEERTILNFRKQEGKWCLMSNNAFRLQNIFNDSLNTYKR